MKIQWCWRCGADVPMLDEAEFSKVEESSRSESPRATTVGPVRGVAERFEAMLAMYYQLTGLAETNPAAIMHHRLALYGVPCGTCGKPLRTPVARFCAACGAKPDNGTNRAP